MAPRRENNSSYKLPPACLPSHPEYVLCLVLLVWMSERHEHLDSEEQLVLEMKQEYTSLHPHNRL